MATLAVIVGASTGLGIAISRRLLDALSDLEQTLAAGRTQATVGDICSRTLLTAFPDETLDEALQHFGALDVGRIPVVDRHNPRRLVGMLRRGILCMPIRTR